MSVIQKTAKKMSPAGLEAIARVPLDDADRARLERAVGPAAPVHRYLDALARQAWDELAATVAPDIERSGPYGDDFHGRDDYIAFLRSTLTMLSGYELHVERVIATGPTVVVELDETVDAEGGRLRTEEAIVFDVVDDLITRVAVYLQKSELG